MYDDRRRYSWSWSLPFGNYFLPCFWKKICSLLSILFCALFSPLFPKIPLLASKFFRNNSYQQFLFVLQRTWQKGGRFLMSTISSLGPDHFHLKITSVLFGENVLSIFFSLFSLVFSENGVKFFFEMTFTPKFYLCSKGRGKKAKGV